jgi:hypothetical protein
VGRSRVSISTSISTSTLSFGEAGSTSKRRWGVQRNVWAEDFDRYTVAWVLMIKAN